MAESVRRRSWGGVLPLGRHASISGSRSIHAPSVSIAPPPIRRSKTPVITTGSSANRPLYGDVDVKVRVQWQRSSGFVGREDGYELIRGELAIGRGSSRRNLVSGGPLGARTMMQPCASAAKLRGGGSNLNSGFQANPLFGAPPPRIIHGRSPRRHR